MQERNIQERQAQSMSDLSAKHNSGSGPGQPHNKFAAVLHLLDTTGFAGTERYVLTLAREQREQGALVTVACSPASALHAHCREHALNTIDAPRERLDMRFTRALKTKLQAGQIAVVHAHNGRTALTAAVAVHWAQRGRCVLTQHFLQPAHVAHRGTKGAAFRAVHHWAHRHLHHTIAISEAVRASSLARGDVSSNDITVVPNGIFEPGAADINSSARTRASLGVSTQTPLIVCAARLEPEKDVETLIAAMAHVVTKSPDAHCIVAGTGSQQEFLHKTIEQLHLSDRVSLLGYRSDVLSLIHAGDIFVLPSLAEPFGLALLEAMALGRPVVATAAGGPLEIVTPGCTGLLVPPSHPQELANALLTLLGDVEARRWMGQNGYQRFQRCFTARQMAQATLDVYKQILL
jgi:glycosyltransferase involved in cell wall biosynthesis